MTRTWFFWNKRQAALLCLLFIVGMLASVYYLSSTCLLSLTRRVPIGPSARNPSVLSARPCLSSDPLHYKQPSALSSRTDVAAVTPWLAPIVWESTFEPALLDSIYKPCNITVATTVFAIGEYIRFLKDFLETAETHFFVGYRVHYYVFTDRPDQVPSIKMPAGRELFVRQTPNLERWQAITASRNKMIANFIETELRDGTDYVYCFDVDSKFHGSWGTETLGQLVVVLHHNHYFQERSEFIYERRPESKAFMSADEGDFYYGGGAFGGEPANVHHMLSTCSDNFELDAHRGIEATWQDESHLNRYLWLHKPTKVLSPEYQWHDLRAKPEVLKIIRFSAIVKDYREVRKGWTSKPY